VTSPLPPTADRPRPAILSALYAALPFGLLAASIYFFAKGQSFFKGFKFGQDMVCVGFIGGLWLLFWALIARSRCRPR
jgi:hypothetical protein